MSRKQLPATVYPRLSGKFGINSRNNIIRTLADKGGAVAVSLGQAHIDEAYRQLSKNIV